MKREVLVHVACADASELEAAAGRGPVVLVEPLYGCTAVLAALDAGWDVVELSAERGGDAPVPLVSFEQPPPPGAQACRVRCDDLHAPALELVLRGIRPVLAAPSNARPAMSRIAFELTSTHGSELAPVVTFVPAPSLHVAAPVAASPPLGERLARDSWWACGALVRVLLDELEEADLTVRLDDSAGIAVSVAVPEESPEAAFSSSARMRQHLARGGHPDDIRVASAVDAYGVVARIEPGLAAANGGAPVLTARWWVPAPPVAGAAGATS